jgi:DNA-directed RNA polymerase subunit RPC12/RpoP
MAPFAVCVRGCGYQFDFEGGNPGPKKLQPTTCPQCGGGIASACVRCDTALEAVPTPQSPLCPYCRSDLLAMFKRLDRHFSFLLRVTRSHPVLYRKAG